MRWLVNVWWREPGWPRLTMMETNETDQAVGAGRIPVARQLVRRVRAKVVGPFGIRVTFTPHPQQAEASV